MTQLPCGHEYCKSCVEELRQKGVDKSCPLCRRPLPPGPQKLFDLGYGMYAKIKNAIERGRPDVPIETPWPALAAEEQREMDEARSMLREAADQGHLEAQAHVGDMYSFGCGVEKDDRLAFLYTKKAAQQGDAVCQHNTGVNYKNGLGCEQSYERAAEWFGKAARQGHAGAHAGLGALYCNGYGVPQSFERAVELFKQSVAKGYPVSERDHAQKTYANLK